MNTAYSRKYQALLREFEGFYPDPYVCPAGKCTIGYGTNLEALPQHIPHHDVRLQVKSGLLGGHALVRLLKARGMRWSPEQANAAMCAELDQTHAALMRRCPCYVALRERGESVRAEALLDMAYNMGVGRAPDKARGVKGSGLLGFYATLPLIERGDYAAAVANLQKSAWYRQVGRRARTVCRAIRDGAWPDSLRGV